MFGDVAVTFSCPSCGAVSHNPRDALEGWCGRCRAFTGQLRSLSCPVCRASFLVSPEFAWQPVACPCGGLMEMNQPGEVPVTDSPGEILPAPGEVPVPPSPDAMRWSPGDFEQGKISSPDI
jgi:hypothetical protein